jgi:hypothetical protein
MHGKTYNLCQIGAVKRLFAIGASLLVLWGQAAVGLRAGLPFTAPQPAVCRCCDCAQTDCCVAPAEPVSTPRAPALPVRSVLDEQLSLPVITAVLWVVPEMSAPAPSFLAASLGSASGAPLYERNCALLI